MRASFDTGYPTSLGTFDQGNLGVIDPSILTTAISAGAALATTGIQVGSASEQARLDREARAREARRARAAAVHSRDRAPARAPPPPARAGVPTWVWVAGGVIAVAAVGGAVLLTRSQASHYQRAA